MTSGQPFCLGCKQSRHFGFGITIRKYFFLYLHFKKLMLIEILCDIPVLDFNSLYRTLFYIIRVFIGVLNYDRVIFFIATLYILCSIVVHNKSSISFVDSCLIFIKSSQHISEMNIVLDYDNVQPCCV